MKAQIELRQARLEAYTLRESHARRVAAVVKRNKSQNEAANETPIEPWRNPRTSSGHGATDSGSSSYK